MQVFARDNSANRLSISRNELDNTGQWRADISWEEIQALKAQCGFGDRHAVEIYPSDEDVVNVANMRHIWVLDNPMPFAWRNVK